LGKNFALKSSSRLNQYASLSILDSDSLANQSTLNGKLENRDKSERVHVQGIVKRSDLVAEGSI
jgi:hypothetical protein